MIKTTFKNLITGDVFRFADEETVYLVCYSKHCIGGNDVIEEVERPYIKQMINPFMMDREVVKFSEDEISYI